MANILGDPHKGWPTEYLGLPLRGSPRNKSFWESGLERCRKKLSRWKANYLSFGRRITLIKATLSNLPFHYPFLFKIPKEVAIEVNRIQNQFLRRGQADSKPHLINWKTVSKDKENSSSALGGIVNRNTALLGKWLWSL